MKSTSGTRLFELMESRGLTAADLASAVNIPKSSMSMYLSDKRKMKADRIKIISDKYNVSDGL